MQYKYFNEYLISKQMRHRNLYFIEENEKSEIKNNHDSKELILI
jgi:hypothetical protein